MKQKTSQQVKAKKSKNQKEKSNTKQPLSWMAQELLARNCGLLKMDKRLDDMMLQQYIDMYKHPLNEESMHAILKLTKVATEKKKKKKKKKKKDKKTPLCAHPKEQGLGKVPKKKTKKGGKGSPMAVA
jgi:hypothetical protein